VINKIRKNTFFRYCFLGGIAALVELGTFYLMINYLGLNYILVAPISFVFGAITNYFLQSKVNFKSTYKNKHKQFTIFFVIALGGMIVNWIATVAYAEFLFLAPTIAKLGAILTALIYNYTLNKKITFGRLEKNKIKE